MAKLSLFDRRRQRVRTTLRSRGAGKPRLSVHRSGRHIYAQVIDDAQGRTLAAASTIEKELRDSLKTGADKDAAVVPPRQQRLADALPNPTVVHAPIDHTGCVTRPAAFVPALLEAIAAVTA